MGPNHRSGPVERSNTSWTMPFPTLASGSLPPLGDAERGELLGAHMTGPEVTELLPELTPARMWDLTAHEIARNIHAHPTLGEAVKEVVHGLVGPMINL
ncbi:hypothetical protein OHU26_37555 (plasmid) [Streptomyces sp. NBC_00069]